MRKLLLVLGIILAIIIAFIYSVNWDYAFSVVPGWHTNIYPVWFISLVIAVPVLVIMIFIYLFKKSIKRK